MNEVTKKFFLTSTNFPSGKLDLNPKEDKSKSTCWTFLTDFVAVIVDNLSLYTV